MTAFAFHNDTDHHRYEATLDNVPAGFVEYSLLADAIMLSHTEVLPNFEGKGVGGFLARESLASVRAAGKRVIPACPFIAAYLRKHPEFLDLVDPDVKRAYRI